MDIRFLTVDEAMLIHVRSIQAHGGSMGIRDLGLLQSALAMPRGGFGGQFLHEFPHEMAAAYLFHVAANHPFIDGNKRTALLCALMFLDVNGHKLAASKKEVEETVLKVAASQMTKDALVLFFKKHVRRA
jgi:death-on-curing protein